MRFYFQSFITVLFFALLIVHHVSALIVVTKVISQTITTCTTDQGVTSKSAPITLSSDSSIYSSRGYSDTIISPSESGSGTVISTTTTESISSGGEGGGGSSSSFSSLVFTNSSSYIPYNATSSWTTLSSTSRSSVSLISSTESSSEAYTSVAESSSCTESSSETLSTSQSSSSTESSSETLTSTSESSISLTTSASSSSETGSTSASFTESSYSTSVSSSLSSEITSSSTSETSSSSVETTSESITSTSETSTSSSTTSETSTSTSETSTASSTTTSETSTSASETSTSSTTASESSTSTSESSTVSSTTSSSSSSSSTESSTSSSTASSSTSSSSTSSSSSSLSSSSSVSSSSSSATSSSSSSTTSSTSASSSSSSTSSSSTSSASATATPCSYWLEDIKHQGIAPFNSNSGSYEVFRNVKDYGAKGDGVTDDTAAINLAISSGGRCAPGTCASSTTNPALVYFPNGTYLVSSPIIDYYYTQLIGNPNCLPIIKAKSTFSDRWVIDGDQYQAGGKLGWGATNIFWRQIRNFVIDLTGVAPSQLVAGIHWPTGQATSLQNILFKMSTASGVQHEGVFIEEGSGGFVADLTFYGGFHGMTIGNQQFTMRNLTFHNAVVAISQLWDWGWTYKGISINNCGVGLDMTAIDTNDDINKGAQNVASITFIDSDINDTPIGIAMARNSTSTAPSGGSLILENVRLKNVQTAVQGPQGPVLAGSAGSSLISAWGQGHAYNPTGPTVFQGQIDATTRPGSVTAGTDYYERSKPQYENVPKSEFISARDAGAKGDGVTDDTAAIKTLLATAAASGKIVFFDAGVYLVTSTIYIPPSSRIAGEAYPVILSSGAFFSSIDSPKPVIQVGLAGESGSIEWSDVIVSTQGAQAGAILIEYNLSSSPSSPSGLWDVHTRIGGFTGSSLQVSQCPKTPTVTITSANLAQQCIAAFLSLHITSSASGVYLENNWFWVADHDVDDSALTQITVYAGRGLLIESASGGIQLVGTAVEHHQLYEYQLSNTRDIVLGQIQTETAYYQPNPAANLPFPSLAAYNDPTFSSPDSSGWGLRIVDSEDITVYGAGLYSFFSDYDVHCSDQGNGETCQARIFSVESSSGVRVFNLNTVGTGNMITLDGVDVAKYSDNLNGFADTIALFEV